MSDPANPGRDQALARLGDLKRLRDIVRQHGDGGAIRIPDLPAPVRAEAEQLLSRIGPMGEDAAEVAGRQDDLLSIARAEAFLREIIEREDQDEAVRRRAESQLAQFRDLRGRLAGLPPDDDPDEEMSPEDAARWRSARTLADFGELTALWLEGKIGSQPANSAGAGPDEETGALIPVLAACNRAGYLTTTSQPGEPPETGYNGATWIQRAAVEGFAATPVLEALRTAVAGTPLLLVASPTGDETSSSEVRIPVTLNGGTENTWLGGAIDAENLDHFYGDHCHPAVIGALAATWNVAIIDPEWGRNDVLWPVLSEFASRRGYPPAEPPESSSP